MSLLGKFLPNANNRQLFPGFVAFCEAGIGVALGFVASAMSARWLGLLAFAITALGVISGMLFVFYRWWSIFKTGGHKKED